MRLINVTIGGCLLQFDAVMLQFEVDKCTFQGWLMLQFDAVMLQFEVDKC